jgi:hypothetical protein
MLKKKYSTKNEAAKVKVFEGVDQADICFSVLKPLLDFIGPENGVLPKHYAMSDYPALPLGLLSGYKRASEDMRETAMSKFIYKMARKLSKFVLTSWRIPYETGMGKSPNYDYYKKDKNRLMKFSKHNGWLEFGVGQVYLRLEPKFRERDVIDWKEVVHLQKADPRVCEGFTSVRPRLIFALPPVNSLISWLTYSYKEYFSIGRYTFYNKFKVENGFVEMNSKIEQGWYQHNVDTHQCDQSTKKVDNYAAIEGMVDTYKKGSRYTINLGLVCKLLLQCHMAIFNDHTMDRGDFYKLKSPYFGINSGHGLVTFLGTIVTFSYQIQAFYPHYKRPNEDIDSFVDCILDGSHPNIKMCGAGDNWWVQVRKKVIDIDKMDFHHYKVEDDPDGTFLGNKLIFCEKTKKLRWARNPVTYVTNWWVPEFSITSSERARPSDGWDKRRSAILTHPLGEELIQLEHDLMRENKIKPVFPHNPLQISRDLQKSRYDETLKHVKDNNYYTWASESDLKRMMLELSKTRTSDIEKFYEDSFEDTEMEVA